ncbi:hypothetical protein COOONC_17750, partial [Cooperia oncophora]
ATAVKKLFSWSQFKSAISPLIASTTTTPCIEWKNTSMQAVTFILERRNRCITQWRNVKRSGTHAMSWKKRRKLSKNVSRQQKSSRNTPLCRSVKNVMRKCTETSKQQAFENVLG